jgi:hypothetical protein
MEALLSYSHNTTETSNIFQSNVLDKKLITSVSSPSKSTSPTPSIVSYPKMFSPNQIQNSLLSQYAASDQQQMSIAAAAHLAAEMHQSRYSYQQNLDFLKIFAPSTSSSSSRTMSQQCLTTSPDTSNIYVSPISPKLNLLATSAASNSIADKLLVSSSHTGMGGILTPHGNVFLPNDESPFYNSVSASFVGRLASK